VVHLCSIFTRNSGVDRPLVQTFRSAITLRIRLFCGEESWVLANYATSGIAL
jgi:hypothetical protein